TIVPARDERSGLPRAYYVHSSGIEVLLKNKNVLVVALRHSHLRIQTQNSLTLAAQEQVPAKICFNLCILQIWNAQEDFLATFVLIKIKYGTQQTETVSADIECSTEIQEVVEGVEA